MEDTLNKAVNTILSLPEGIKTHANRIFEELEKEGIYLSHWGIRTNPVRKCAKCGEDNVTGLQIVNPNRLYVEVKRRMKEFTCRIEHLTL